MGWFTSIWVIFWVKCRVPGVDTVTSITLFHKKLITAMVQGIIPDCCSRNDGKFIYISILILLNSTWSLLKLICNKLQGCTRGFIYTKHFMRIGRLGNLKKTEKTIWDPEEGRELEPKDKILEGMHLPKYGRVIGSTFHPPPPKELFIWGLISISDSQ